MVENRLVGIEVKGFGRNFVFNRKNVFECEFFSRLTIQPPPVLHSTCEIDFSTRCWRFRYVNWNVGGVLSSSTPDRKTPGHIQTRRFELFERKYVFRLETSFEVEMFVMFLYSRSHLFAYLIDATVGKGPCVWLVILLLVFTTKLANKKISHSLSIAHRINQ